MYDEQFFLDEARVARESARYVMPWVMKRYPSYRIIDVGCGTGEWLLALRDYVVVLLGVDLYAPMTDGLSVLRQDISNGVDCTDQNLAICLETAEHLPESSAEPLVAGLAKAGTVLWSAATPGQPGVDHINCQPHDYWHGLFAQHGMTPEFIGDKFTEPVADFYRRNMYLYRRTA